MTSLLSFPLPLIHNTEYDELLFVKLGGSLITDKNQPMTAKVELIRSVLAEIARFLERSPRTRLILGHGSGSFGHSVAKQFGTRDGVRDDLGWQGFHGVWHAAHELHQIVMRCGLELDVPLPLISFPPSACISTSDRKITQWNLEPLANAVDNGLIPVVYGDVVFDDTLGGTILSTEELFIHLASVFQPERVLLFGLEDGVFSDFPDCKKMIPVINTNSPLSSALQGSGSTDVTGGMREKVSLMQQLCALSPNTTVYICPGYESSLIKDALLGRDMGTMITF